MTTLLSLLMVEDSETDAELVAIELRRYGYDVSFTRVDDHVGLRGALGSQRWDVVICDHGLPSFDSGEALQIVRHSRADVPFIVLSGSIGEEAAVAALKAGARDVVLKTNLARLGPVVERELAEAQNRLRQREAERALQESEARKTAILDSALDGVVTIDHEGRVIDFNPAAEAMFGYEGGAIRGKPMAHLIIPQSLRPQHERGFLRQIAGEESTVLGRRVELVGMRADGSEFPVELSITRGELSGRPFFTGYVRDITQRREAEAERASLEAQLRQAQKMDAIGSLAGGITHDFNNILAIVNGYSELVLRRLPPDDPVRPQVEEIARAGDKALSLTRQLLAFTRRQVLEPTVLDLNEVILGIQPLLERVLGEDVELVTRLEPDLKAVKADASQLEQVIMNLAANARDAMPAGGTLAIESRMVDLGDDQVVSAPAGRYSLLSVIDTGVGIDGETQERIFEPFFTTKDVGYGTGLGLSTVYGIVKQSGGYIWVESAPGDGATFNVALPVVATPVEASEQPPAEIEPATGSGTVLLVEDDDGLRLLVQELLEYEGFTVLAARNAEAAIDIFERENKGIGLVVTDLVMPGIGGFELGRALRAVRPGVKLLFMSGYSKQEPADASAMGPGAVFIQKPFTPASLNLKIRELLEPA